MRIRHVIPLLDPGAKPELVAAQELTLESLRAARDAAGVTVEVIGARTPESPPAPAWMRDAPVLLLSARDLHGAVHPPMPLLGEIFDGFGLEGPFDLGIYTNIDIAVQPGFYDWCASTHRNGHTSFSVTRRTVAQQEPPYDYQRGRAEDGAPHPGDDCFAIDSLMITRFELGNVVIGVPPVGKAMAVNCILQDPTYRKFWDEHLTFHIGDDREWMSAHDLGTLNSAAYEDVKRTLSGEFGPTAVEEADAASWGSPGFREHAPEPAADEGADQVRSGSSWLTRQLRRSRRSER